MKKRLDELLVERGLAESRTLAQRLIREGKVRVEGRPNPKPGNQYPDDIGSGWWCFFCFRCWETTCFNMFQDRNHQ